MQPSHEGIDVEGAVRGRAGDALGQAFSGGDDHIAALAGRRHCVRSGNPAGQSRAATAAHWLIEQGLEVDCDCSLRIAVDQARPVRAA